MDFRAFKSEYQREKVIENFNTVGKNPMLSVCVQTYQHVNYIKGCLDGILMQQTTFPIEILLGEDESTDGTRQICTQYAGKYPNKIRLFLHHRENNIKINGAPTGRFNFVYNFFHVRGKYIAICEGDDFWTDPLKLQKQVDFLEKHQEYGICFHRINILNQLDNTVLSDNITKEVPETTGIEDLAKGNFIHTPSVVLRNDFVLPSWFLDCPLGDWSLYILQIKNKKIKKLEEEMAVYRIHPSGMWANKSQEERNEITNKNVKLIYHKAKVNKETKEVLKNKLVAKNVLFLKLEKLVQKLKV